MAEIHQNDRGTEFRITTLDHNGSALDISSSTDKSVIFKKPSGSRATGTASFYTDGSDGVLSYTAPSGLLNEVGTWKVQAQVVSSNGSWKSEFKSFKVYRNI